jgi:hypothetical protein
MPTYRLPPWFNSYIRQDNVLFHYIGERQLLMAALTARPFFRRLLDLVLPHANISALLKAVAGIPPLSSTTAPTLGSDIVAAWNAADLQRTLAELLALHHEKSRSEGRNFEQVTRLAYNKAAVFTTRFQDLQDRLATIQGQLIHRDALQQYNPLAAVPVLKSQSEWFLADTPPHLQMTGDPDVTGQYVLLAQGFYSAL